MTVGCAPECHETGNLYEHVGGPPLTELSVLTESERKTLHAVARSFDHGIGNAHVDEPVPGYERSKPGESPGDAFNQRATWEEILAGWQPVGESGGIKRWRRPGKAAGYSATTGIRSKAGNDLLTVFSTNAFPFEGVTPEGRPGVTYNKFSAYALLNHDGDFKAAAKGLVTKGYGTPSKNGKRKGEGSSAKPNDKIPTIAIGVDESRVVDEAIKALAKLANIYQRAGLLVQVVRDQPPPCGISKPKDAPRIVPLRLPRLQELMASAANWVQPTEEGDPELRHPPGWAVKAVDARGEWTGILRLDAVVESPILRADGSVLQTPGYDAETGLIFAPQVEFPEVPTNPTQTDVERALGALLAVIVDFPFGTEAHRAAWLSGVLTPLSRFAYHGPAPLHLMDANVRGCGKSLLTDVTGVITAGRSMARMTQPRDEDEFRKRITSLAMAGESLILIDNVAGALGGSSLDAALTATTWSDRILGRSEMASNLPLFATWYATGNNVVLLADTSRRTLHVRLESPEESPEERTGFRQPDLLAWVRQERPRLTVAAMTVLRGYCAAGRPSMGLTPWGSFEGWSDLVRQSIVWCGLPDPGETRQELAGQADVEAVSLAQLIDGWAKIDPNGIGMTIASVMDTIADFQKNFTATMPEEYQQVRDAINELVPARGGRIPTSRSVGMKFNHLRRRIVGGRCLDRRIARMGNLWHVRTADVCGTSGTSGTNSALARGHACAPARTRTREADLTGPASPVSPATTADENADIEEFLRS